MSTEETLWGMGLAQFRDATASADPTPGGGSVAGVCATFGLGLVIMALEISVKRKDAQRIDETSALIAAARELMASLTADADEDVRAFRAYMAALKLPKATDDEKAARRQAMQHATRAATQAPLTAGRHILEALQMAECAVPLSHLHVVSDVGAGAGLLEGSLKAVLFNVDINLPSLADPVLQQSCREERSALAADGVALAESVLASVAAKLAGG
jgi:formiminotetrahydrofolate cyclodeaminase